MIKIIIMYLIFLALVAVFFCSLCSVGKQYDEDIMEELNNNIKNKNN